MKNKRRFVVILAVIAIFCVSLALTACKGDEHTYGDLIAEVAATCEKAGTKAHYYCPDCEKYFDADKNEVTAESLVIPALGHDLQDVGVIPATCAKAGTEAGKKCSRCDYTEGLAEIPALGHTYGALIEKVNATCEEDGMEAHFYCEVCKTYFDAEKKETTEEDLTIEALGHEYGELVEKVNATCEGEGMEAYFYCDVCKTYFDADKKKTTEEDLVIEALGHTYGALVEKVDATCEEDGMEAHFYCGVCKTYFDADKKKTTAQDLAINALGHEYGDKINQKDATCEEEGMQEHFYCEVCKTYFDADKKKTTKEDLTIGANGHDTEEVKGKEATCTEDGLLDHWHCKTCGKNFEDEAGTKLLAKTVIDALGHDVDPSALSITNYPTFEQEGSFTTGTCKRGCGYTGGQGTLPKLDDENYTISKNTATCEDGGRGTYTIVVEGVKVEFEADTAKLGHDLSEVEGKDATCTEDGVVAHWHCNTCGKNYTDETATELVEKTVVDALGHEYGDWIDEEDATCEKDGMKAHYYCEVCKTYFNADKQEIAREELVIASNGHDLKEVKGKDATCTEDGVVAHWHCDICGKNYTDESATELVEKTVVDALGHEYGDKIEEKKPTCEETGMQAHYYCEVCETYFDAEKHETTEEALTVNALGHTYGELVEEEPATCETDGMAAHYYCEVCKTYFDAEQNKTTREALVIAKRHTLEQVQGKEATCTEDGVVAHWHCTACEKNFTDETASELVEKTVVDALGHEFENYACKRGDFDIKKATGATLATNEEQTKVYFVVSGKYTYYETTELETVLKALAFDLQRNGFRGGNDWSGDWTKYNELECIVEFTEGTWSLKYDITNLPVNENDFVPYYTSHFNGDLKLPTEQTEDISVTVNNFKYSIVNFYGRNDATTGYGTVALQIADLSNPVYETTCATLEADEDAGKVYFVIRGTYRVYSDEELKGILTNLYFDMQKRGDDWGRSTFERIVSVSGGEWSIKFDVTNLDIHANPYTGHFGGSDDKNTSDLKLSASQAQDGYEVSLGGRLYTLVNKVGSSAEADNWGCVSLKIETATMFTVTGASLEKSEDGKMYLVLTATVRGYNLATDVITMGNGSDVHSLEKYESVGATAYKLYFDVSERTTELWCHVYINGQPNPHDHDGNVYAGSAGTSAELDGKTFKFRRDDGCWWILVLLIEG